MLDNDYLPTVAASHFTVDVVSAWRLTLRKPPDCSVRTGQVPTIDNPSSTSADRKVCHPLETTPPDSDSLCLKAWEIEMGKPAMASLGICAIVCRIPSKISFLPGFIGGCAAHTVSIVAAYEQRVACRPTRSTVCVWVHVGRENGSTRCGQRVGRSGLSCILSLTTCIRSARRPAQQLASRCLLPRQALRSRRRERKVRPCHFDPALARPSTTR